MISDSGLKKKKKLYRYISRRHRCRPEIKSQGMWFLVYIYIIIISYIIHFLGLYIVFNLDTGVRERVSYCLLHRRMSTGSKKKNPYEDHVVLIVTIYRVL